MHLCALLFATVLLAFIRPAPGSPSNAGSEFYVGFMKTIEGNALTISISVTTTELLPVHFTVSNSTTTIHSGTAHNSSVTEIVLSTSYIVTNIAERNKGLQIHVTDADKTIIAYGLNYRSNTADGFLVLPCNKYWVENYTYFAVSTMTNALSSEVLLVGCEDTTEVTIIPTQTIQIPSDLVREGNSAITVPPGESYTVTLNRMQTYQFSSLLDLTGSKVISNKPVAFFSGHQCAEVPINAPNCDHLVEQLPPTITWGQLFYTASLKGRTSGEWYKVISSRIATTVVVYCSLNGSSNLTNFTINLSRAGSSQEFNTRQNMFCSIQANKPVMVVQFATGGGAEDPDRYGDPFMMMIPPVEQYKSSFTFVSQSNFDNFLTITVPVQFYNPSMIVLNGTALTSTSWTPINCSSVDICGYATRTSISIGINYIRHLNPDAVFGVVVYGFDRLDSYGYPAGMELTSNQNVEISVMVSGPLYTGNRGMLTCSIMVNTSILLLSEATIVTIWRKGVVQLTNNSRTNISEAFIDGNGTIFASNVMISPVEASDSGDYTCEAILDSSAAGTVSSISGVLTLAIQAPNKPTGLSGFARGPTDITLTWLMDTNIDHFVVVVNETQTQKLQRFDTVNTHITITSLHPYYLYECQVAAFEVIRGPFSNSVQVRTEEDAPSSPPANLTVTALTAQSASVSWDPVPFEHQNGLVQQYVIRLNDAGTITHQISNTTEANIKNLRLFTTYLISVSAETVGVGPYTDEIRVTLPEDATSTALFRLRLIGVGSCREWLSEVSTPAEKVQTLTSAIAENVEQLCSCGVTVDDITNTGFGCFSDNTNEVTFCGELSAPVSHVNLSSVLTQWVESGAVIVVDGVRLTFDSAEIQSLSEQECETTPESSGVVVPAVVGSVAAVVVAVIIVVALVVIITVARHHFRNRRSATSTKTSTEIPMAENIAYYVNSRNRRSAISTKTSTEIPMAENIAYYVNSRNRRSAISTKTSTEIPMAENIAYGEIKKQQLQQNIDEHVPMAENIAYGEIKKKQLQKNIDECAYATVTF